MHSYVDFLVLQTGLIQWDLTKNDQRLADYISNAIS